MKTFLPVSLGLAFVLGIALSLPARVRGDGGDNRGHPLLIIGDGQFSLFESSCNSDFKGFTFPVLLVSEGQQIPGTVRVETCFRAAPGGNSARLVNESETEFSFDDGSTISVRMTTFGLAAPGDPGFINLTLIGTGNVIGTHGTRARIGGNVRQDGIVVEQICTAANPCPGGLGAGILPVLAKGATYMIESD
jgi:hypothetical protein